jgi:DNA-binding MarR family transcriptional regulator
VNRAIGDDPERTMRDSVQQLLCESRRVIQAVGEAREDTLAGAGVTPIERSLMEALAHEDTPITVATLARRALTPLADIAGGLDQLERRGWLDRCGNSQHASREYVRLNEAGRAVRRTLRDNEHALLEQLGVVLGEQSVRTALATLRLLRRTLQRVAIPVPSQGPDSMRATCRQPLQSTACPE